MTKLDAVSLSQPTPPVDLPSSLQALWWLKKGDFVVGTEWKKAHAICQQNEGKLDYDLIHALAHWIEGDESNANYWYHKVGAKRAATIAAEWERLVAKIGSEPSA
jgi:hypothetical protein